ncbi:hypothetical protein [Nocardiopsis coralliicola]
MDAEAEAAGAPGQPGRARRIGRAALRLFPRVLGLFTAAYAVWVIADPAALTGPLGMPADDPGTEVLVRTMLVRDAACGAAMLLAPYGAPLLTAIAIRVASDLGDAVLFGTLLPAAEARPAAIAVAGAFGLVCALSALGAGRRR